ncbi:MAG: hypothetical protein RLZZ375_806 [Pseudomonadota bacterium]
MVEGTSLLRKHMGLNLYRGFESLGLRHANFPQMFDFDHATSQARLLRLTRDSNAVIVKAPRPVLTSATSDKITASLAIVLPADETASMASIQSSGADLAGLHPVGMTIQTVTA